MGAVVRGDGRALVSWSGRLPRWARRPRPRRSVGRAGPPPSRR